MGMTSKEAGEIGLLIGYADRGCPSCVSDLCERANKMFPEFYWVATDKMIYEEIEDGWTESYCVVVVTRNLDK